MRHPEPFATEYVSGRLSGQMGTDEVWVGPYAARQQPLGLIAQERKHDKCAGNACKNAWISCLEVINTAIYRPFASSSQEYGSAFSWDPIDGIVGLGFTELAVKTRPLLDTLLESPGLLRIQLIELRTLPRAEFAFFLYKARKSFFEGLLNYCRTSPRVGLWCGAMRKSFSSTRNPSHGFPWSRSGSGPCG